MPVKLSQCRSANNCTTNYSFNFSFWHLYVKSLNCSSVSNIYSGSTCSFHWLNIIMASPFYQIDIFLTTSFSANFPKIQPHILYFILFFLKVWDHHQNIKIKFKGFVWPTCRSICKLKLLWWHLVGLRCRPRFDSSLILKMPFPRPDLFVSASSCSKIQYCWK